MTRRSETAKTRTALFPGSFNPFTKGHESLVERALTFCDRVVIAIGVNPDKSIDTGLSLRMERIKAIFADDTRVEVAAYSTLTAEYAGSIDADFILRGVRGIVDFDYEQHLADTNRRLFGIETVFLPAIPELAWISSSTVRELDRFGFDTAPLLPSSDFNNPEQ